MKLHIFKAHKQGITEAMQETLTMSKALGRPLKDYCIQEVKEDVYIYANEDRNELDLDELLYKVEQLRKKPNSTMSIHGGTKPAGRYDYFSYVRFIATIDTIKDTIEPHQIEEAMKLLVKKHMGLKSYANLDCKIMDLYKSEVITWEEATEAMHKQCEIL